MSDKPLEVVLSDEALADIEEMMTPEEAQELMDAIKAAVQDGTFFAESEPVDLDRLEEEDPELYAILVERMDSIDIDEDGEVNTNTKRTLN